MKKTILLFAFSLVFTALFSCGGDVNSPNRKEARKVAIEISDHILSGNHITSIAFDAQGAAWVGTLRQGLIKYDGSTTFYNSNNSSLPDRIFIMDIEIDLSGSIWIGSDIGLIKYDGATFKYLIPLIRRLPKTQSGQLPLLRTTCCGFPHLDSGKAAL